MAPENKHCPYLSANLEEDGAKIDTTKPCLLRIFKGKGFKAGRGICPRCEKLVAKGTFDNASVGSLTDIDTSKK